jgi:hypothetical protein
VLSQSALTSLAARRKMEQQQVEMIKAATLMMLPLRKPLALSKNYIAIYETI